MAVRAPTGHDDLIHDAQLDYYGLRLATCSSDRVVKIFDLISQNGAAPKVQFSCDLLGHTGPVWEVAWAHPRWGTLLASCSYDASVIIHRMNESGTWEEAFRHTGKGSMNSIEWCPYEYGLALACASSDSHVYIIRCDVTTGVWAIEKELVADKLGCNSVTWAPYGALGSLTPDGRCILRIATGGCDQKVKILRCEMDQSNSYVWSNEPEIVLDHHQDWVRDVAWAPSIGLPYNLLASCSEDGSVCIWSQESEQDTKWAKEVLPNFKAPVWRVAWSVTGSLLAVSAGDSDVTLWKESLEEKKWTKISEVKDKIPAAPIVPAASETKYPPVNAAKAEKPSSPRQVEKKEVPAETVAAASAAPVHEPQTEAPVEEPKPSLTWEAPPAENNPSASSETWPQDQQPEAWSSNNGDAGAVAGAQQTYEGDNQPQQSNDGSLNYDQQQYDPNQQHDPNQQAFDPNQQQYDPNQQYYDYNYDPQGQYYQGGEYDPNQQQGYYANPPAGEYWDPNQQQAYYGEQQQGEYSDPSQQQQQYEYNQQQPPHQHEPNAAAPGGYGLAAPPVNAGATYNQPGQQPW